MQKKIEQLTVKRNELQKRIDRKQAKRKEALSKADRMTEMEDLLQLFDTESQIISQLEKQRGQIDAQINLLREGVQRLCIDRGKREGCEIKISSKRLKFTPFAIRCIPCQRALEEEEQVEKDIGNGRRRGHPRHLV